MSNIFAGMSIFAPGVPIELRPGLEAQLAGSSIAFITIGRPLSDFDHRIIGFDRRVICVWGDWFWGESASRYREDAVRYAHASQTPLFSVGVADVDGHFSITEVDASILLQTLQSSEAPADLEKEELDPLAGLLFGVTSNDIAVSTLSVLDVTVDDITMVISVRAHDKNPWVINRLGALASLYSPAPRVVIVDFGSEIDYSEKIEDICRSSGFIYTYVDDKGVFSASEARNAGFQASETDLIFFNDIDFVFPSDFFGKLATLATRLDVASFIDIPLMCAAVHLSEASTIAYIGQPDAKSRDAILTQLGHRAVYEKFGPEVEFVAPYSNIFLVHRNLYSLIGGYNSEFRGHGSEDFEFFCRLNIYSNQFPSPKNLLKDAGGPLKKEFFATKDYEGFRALNAAVCLPGELQGLKAFHLYHPKDNTDGWRANNDWKRDRLKNTMGAFEEDKHNVLKVDGLPRPKRVICVCANKEHWGYFAPLRLLGYETIPIFGDSVSETEYATSLIANAEVEAFAIFNPYMDSHMKFRSLFYLAKRFLDVIVIERGALPGTIYYADDVAYASDEYSRAAFDAFVPNSDDLEQAESYMSEIRKGEKALEKGASYAYTARKYAALKASGRTICFVPLQLAEDMAVTMFVRDAQNYPDFYSSINATAAANPDQTFLIKPHPLSKGSTALKAPNIILADRGDNIHCLLDLASYVVAYNSGVALLAMAHDSPVFTVGNAYFNRGGAGNWASSFAAAVEDFSARKPVANRAAAAKVYAWLTSKMYSEFTATDDIREFANRLAHGYKNIVVTRLSYKNNIAKLARRRANHSAIRETYGFARQNYALPKPPVAAAAPASVKKT